MEIITGKFAFYSKHLEDYVWRQHTLLQTSKQNFFSMYYRVGGKKYTYAMKNKILVVTPLWLQKCYVGHKKVPEKDFSLNIFTGLTICLSGFEFSKKETIFKEIEKFGGFFTRDFNPAKTTHLISSTPSGKKYDAAISAKYKTEIVNLSWLTESIEAKMCLPESDYTLRMKENEPDFNSAEPPNVTDRKDSTENIKSDLVELIDETSTKISENMKEHLKVQDSNYKQLMILSKKAISGSVPVYRSLAGIPIFITGFDSAISSHLLICLLAADAFVLDEFNSLVRIVVLGDKINKEYENVLRRTCLLFVDLSWVLNCFKPQESLPAFNEDEVKKPEQNLLPLKGKIVIVTKYVDQERNEVRELTELLGGQYTETFRSSESENAILIAKSKSGEKYDAARMWKVKVHDLEWLRKLKEKISYQ